MIRFLTIVFLASVLSACGGGGESPNAEPTQASAAAPIAAPAHVCVPRVVSVALLGDSTMYGSMFVQGVGYVQATHNPGVQLQAAMDAQFGPGAVVVTNYGVPGSTATQANPIVAHVVVANYGINDAARGESGEVFTAAMKAIGVTLIETQNPQAGDLGNSMAAPFVAIERSLGLPVADTFAYVQTLQNWKTMEPDGIHPTDELYQLIVANVLAPAVAKQVAPLRCM